jgi:hypothetical protein
MSVIRVHPAFTAQPAQPRGALWAAQAGAYVIGLLRQAFARSTSNVARSRADEAEAVRRLAAQVQASDPGFAEDLYAAANRHESAE